MAKKKAQNIAAWRRRKYSGLSKWLAKRRNENETHLKPETEGEGVRSSSEMTEMTINDSGYEAIC